MKNVCLLLCGDVHYDDRVQKEVVSISKVANVSVFYLKNRKTKKHFTNKKIHEFPVNVHLPINKITVIFYEFLILLNVIKTKERYDVIWASDIDTLLVGYILKKILKAKLIYDSHELWYGEASFKTKSFIDLYKRAYLLLFLFIEKHCIKHVDAIISTNEKRKELLIKHYPFIKNKIHIIIHNYPKGRPIKKQIHKKGVIHIIYYGILRGRNLIDFIRALKIKSDTRISLSILCKRESFEKFILPEINHNKLQKIVKYLGYIPPEEIDKHLKKDDFGLAFYPPISLNYIYPESGKFYRYVINGVIPITNSKYLKSKCPNGVIYLNNFKPQSILEVLNKIVSMSVKELNKYYTNVNNCAKKFIWEEHKIFTLLQQLLQNQNK